MLDDNTNDEKQLKKNSKLFGEISKSINNEIQLFHISFEESLEENISNSTQIRNALKTKNKISKALQDLIKDQEKNSSWERHEKGELQILIN
ncbi:bridging integrator 3 [Anaeramoeba flamelloides]|uniref:Bridging integrator 3 n=1 Tax=Anaeramoeba flamelloides TaxID=1746091 RepID=A0ABQ8X1H6_9EUKA|nr:bridging integrator 3 [Anaeramoeba flamelloides]